MTYTKSQLEGKTVKALKKICRDEVGKGKSQYKGYSALNKAPLIAHIIKAQGGGSRTPQPRATPRAPSPPFLGKQVRVKGLQAKPEFNGSLGQVQSYDEAKGRYTVTLHDGRQLALRPQNLEVDQLGPEPAGPGIPPIFKGIAEDCTQDEEWHRDVKLGTGAFGTTYVACRAGNCDYAMKIQRNGVEFDAEVRALSELQSTGLVPKLYAAWTCRRAAAYIVMEKLAPCGFKWNYAGALFHWGNDGSAISGVPMEAFRQIEAGLAKAKAAGWLHLDLHDGNIMCGPDNKILFIDWGLGQKEDGPGLRNFSKKLNCTRREAWNWLANREKLGAYIGFYPYYDYTTERVIPERVQAIKTIWEEVNNNPICLRQTNPDIRDSLCSIYTMPIGFKLIKSRGARKKGEKVYIEVEH